MLPIEPSVCYSSNTFLIRFIAVLGLYKDNPSLIKKWDTMEDTVAPSPAAISEVEDDNRNNNPFIDLMTIIFDRHSNLQAVSLYRTNFTRNAFLN